MAKHVLSLEVPDTLNGCIFRVVDTSIYATTPVNCPLLQITPPGFIHPVNFTTPVIEPGFMANITACDLGLQTDNCGTTYQDIPDGIYIVKYSVSPSELLYVEYNHLRMTCALNRVKQLYCDLSLGACEPSTELMATLNQIRLIQQYLDAAKSYVEICHDPNKGMELYRYAVKLLDKLSCNSDCKTC